MRFSIQRRIIAVFALLSVLPLTLVGVAVVLRSYSLQERQALDQQHAVARRIGVEVISEITKRETTLRQLISVGDFPDLSPAGQNSILSQLLAYDSAFDELTLLNNEGAEIVRVARSRAFTPSDLGNRSEAEEFVTVKATGNVYYSPVHIEPNSGEFLITVAVPQMNIRTNTLQAVLVGDLRLRQISQTLSQIRDVDVSSAYVVDDRNRVVAHPDPSVVLRNTRSPFGLADGLANGLLGGSVFRVVDTLPLGNRDIRIVVEKPTAQAFQLAFESIVVFLIVVILSLLIALTLSVVFARRIVRPIRALGSVAEAITAGDLTARAEVKGVDELGALGNAFNSMTWQLRQVLSNLEQRVEERTTALREANRRTEQASQAKSVFLSNMSHELRTPLNVIIGYSSAMLHVRSMYENVDLPPIYRKDIQLILENGEYLLGLINDVLDLSKIEAGKLEIHRSPVDLHEVVKAVMATAIGLVKEKPVQLRTNLPEGLPYIQADSVRIRQITLNLMSNAIKFTERGTITLEAVVEDRFVRITVTDTGIGIEAHVLPYIFDRFQQAQSDTDRRYGGTGLGLDISKQLTQMHGGDMTVESKVGVGTTFSFTMPIAEAQPASQAPAEFVSDKPEDALVTIFSEDMMSDLSASKTILIVEDEVNARHLMHEILEGAGHIVVDAENSREALSMATSILPDLIILDLQLPDASGREVLQKLKADPLTADIPVIIYTARSAAPIAELSGAALILTKPVAPDILLKTITNLMTTKVN
ncbi:MAG TPA: ATP-binding protein [Aggregatilineales bacterium]|nr:response regulator [Anaerolineales bacterium]HRE48042.1 ATP-binding protein [Aggregatilineales bacterium]